MQTFQPHHLTSLLEFLPVLLGREVVDEVGLFLLQLLHVGLHHLSYPLSALGVEWDAVVKDPHLVWSQVVERPHHHTEPAVLWASFLHWSHQAADLQILALSGPHVGVEVGYEL